MPAAQTMSVLAFWIKYGKTENADLVGQTQKRKYFVYKYGKIKKYDKTGEIHNILLSKQQTKIPSLGLEIPPVGVQVDSIENHWSK